jgi:hypothetical protein
MICALIGALIGAATALTQSVRESCSPTARHRRVVAARLVGCTLITRVLLGGIASVLGTALPWLVAGVVLTNRTRR